MHIYEVILTEMASQKLFHFTTAWNAIDILKNQEFALSAAVGTRSERDMNNGYAYYLSTSRNKINDYTRKTYNQGVMFNLNGNFFNKHHKVKPVDYWGRDMWMATHRQGYPIADIRTSEQEDRVLSNKPTINFQGKATEVIESIHIYLKPQDNDERNSSKTRKVLIEAKRLGIPTYFYTDRENFLLQHPTKTDKADLPQRAERTTPYIGSYGQRYLKPWIEIYHKSDAGNLSSEGKKLVYNITTSWVNPNEDFGLSNDIHNSKGPKSNGREFIEKIIAIMNKEGYSTPRDYAQAMRKKWRSIYGYGEE